MSDNTNNSTSDSCLKFLDVGTGAVARRIAIRSRQGQDPGAPAPGLFWLGGFKSDMKGTKAAALDEWAEKQGRACTRFDYSGHGESSGAFEDGTIGQWLGSPCVCNGSKLDAFCWRPCGASL